MKIEDTNLPINQVPFMNLSDFSEGKYSIIKIAEKYPDYVVKGARTEWKKKTLPGTHPLNNHERIIQDTKDIVDNFGEFIPKTQLVKGKNKKGEIIIYTIQEKVAGKRLDELKYSEEISKQLGIFFDKVIDNYIKHLSYAPGENEPRSFYPDLIPRNFILGTTKSNPNITLYFVDTYPVDSGTLSNVISKSIPSLIYSWPTEWKKFIEEYAEKFKRKISEVKTI